jgi:hypothetical protein
VTTVPTFVDHYATLEANCNASFETIESVFRFLAKRYHPDCQETGDKQRFTKIVEAYETLRDPDRRAAYDESFQSEKSEQSAIVREAGCAASDTADRHHILTLFYAQRRRDMKKPGIGISTLEHMLEIPPEVIGFHIWYFKEKGWITREESGILSITAEGVDKIESTVEKQESASLIRIAEAKNEPTLEASSF